MFRRSALSCQRPGWIDQNHDCSPSNPWQINDSTLRRLWGVNGGEARRCQICGLTVTAIEQNLNPNASTGSWYSYLSS